MPEDSNNLIPYFIPALSAILFNAEDKKGSPLDYEEVISIRDGASCMMMEVDDAKKMDESRGYVDLDPENIWYEWQMLRRDLGRKPDIDPGPSFAQMDSQSAEYQNAISQAHETLSKFRAMLPEDGSPMFEAMVKLKLRDGDNSAFMWLANTRLDGNGFIAEIFEVPEFFPNVEVGQQFSVGATDLVDWMVNEGGVLHGGFSLRLHRSKLSETEQKQFDQHVGVTKYA